MVVICNCITSPALDLPTEETPSGEASAVNLVSSLEVLFKISGEELDVPEILAHCFLPILGSRILILVVQSLMRKYISFKTKFIIENDRPALSLVMTNST